MTTAPSPARRMFPLHDAVEVVRAANLYVDFAAGQVTEIRAIDAASRGERYQSIWAGWFDNAEAIAESLKVLGSASGVFLIPNPVNPALLARRMNRLEQVRGKSTPLTTDTDPPDTLRYSEFHEGQRGTRMAGVEDRMERMTDYTFASLFTAAHELVQQLAEVWAGFDGFCNSRLGVPATTLLTAWQFPTASEVTEMLARYADVKPDPAKVDEYRGIYCRAWDRRIGEDK